MHEVNNIKFTANICTQIRKYNIKYRLNIVAIKTKQNGIQRKAQ